MEYINAAVLVVDMINDFAREGGALYVPRAEEIKEKIQRCLNGARANNVLVFYKNDAHLPDSEEFKKWGSHAVKGTFGAQVIDELEVQPVDYVFDADKHDGFTNPDLAPKLRELNIERLYLMGVVSNICVKETALGAIRNRFEAYVVKDAIAPLPGGNLEKQLKEMKDLGVKITDTENLSEWIYFGHKPK